MCMCRRHPAILIHGLRARMAPKGDVSSLIFSLCHVSSSEGVEMQSTYNLLVYLDPAHLNLSLSPLLSVSLYCFYRK